MTISIFGLGYVGAVTAGCLTKAGHHCIGVDVASAKVEAVNKGRAPIIEPGLAQLFENALANHLLEATSDASEAFQRSDISIICVGTPSTVGGAPNLDFIEEVVKAIAEELTARPKKHTLIFRSTMLPGSTRTLIEQHLQHRLDRGILTVLYFPEFLREGTAVSDFQFPSLSVVGTFDGKPPIDDLSVITGSNPNWVLWEEAELIKYACNAFHATKVAFANEIGRVGKLKGIDARKVMSVLCQDNQLNISPYYLRPGNPFGGSCLPKDVRALTQLGKREGLELPLLSNLLPSNRAHLESLLHLVESSGHRRVVILGLSFKPDTDDLRESCMVDVAQYLLGAGYDLRIIDPQLNLAGLLGSNKRAVDIRLPHLARLLTEDLRDAISPPCAIVAFQRCVSLEDLKESVTSAHCIIDVNGWTELSALPSRYEGLCW